MAEDAIAGRYRRERRLGTGGMSEVWAAWDLELERMVAVKLLGRGADRVRFEREARAAASLSHPNICRLYDFGDAGGRPFMVLEYLPGGTLEERLAPGRPLPQDESARVAAEVAAGLAHAHARGIVHCDLKPSNVLFAAGAEAKIADFGIARLGEGGTITEAGTVLGAAAYLSPEQAAGESTTPASDVYAFGVVLYRMLSGRLPFERTNPLDLARAHRADPPPPLPPTIAPALAGLAMRSLAKDPADRPADGAALLAELTGEDAPTRVVPPAGRRPGGRPRHRGRLLAALAVGAVLLGGGIPVAFVTGGGSPSAPATAPPGESRGTTGGGTTTAPGEGESTATESSPSTMTTTTETTTAARTATRGETTEPTESVSTSTTTAPATTIPTGATTAPGTTLPPRTTAPTTTTAAATKEETTTAETTTGTTVTETFPTTTAGPTP